MVGTLSFFSALVLLVGRHEGHMACEIFYFKIPCMIMKGEMANLGFPREWPINGVCVCCTFVLFECC